MPWGARVWLLIDGFVNSPALGVGDRDRVRFMLRQIQHRQKQAIDRKARLG